MVYTIQIWEEMQIWEIQREGEEIKIATSRVFRMLATLNFLDRTTHNCSIKEKQLWRRCDESHSSQEIQMARGREMTGRQECLRLKNWLLSWLWLTSSWQWQLTGSLALAAWRCSPLSFKNSLAFANIKIHDKVSSFAKQIRLHPKRTKKFNEQIKTWTTRSACSLEMPQ